MSQAYHVMLFPQAMVDVGSETGITDVVIGMPHRGRCEIPLVPAYIHVEAHGYTMPSQI